MESTLVVWVTPVVDLALAATAAALHRLGVAQRLLSTRLTPVGQRVLADDGLCLAQPVVMNYRRQVKVIRSALGGPSAVVIHAVGARAIALASFAIRGRQAGLVAEYGGERWRPWRGCLAVGLPGPAPDAIVVRDDYRLSDVRSHLGAAAAQRLCYVPRAMPCRDIPGHKNPRPLPLVGVDLDAISWAEAAFFFQTLHWLPEVTPCQLLLLGSARARQRARRLSRLHPGEIQRRIRFARTCEEPDKNWLRCAASLHTLSQNSSGASLLEAMAMMATPVLVSDFSTDLLADCDNGIVCAPRNPYALSQRLQALCQQLPMAIEMGSRARARVRAGHAVIDVANHLISLYESLTKHAAPALRSCR